MVKIMTNTGYIDIDKLRQMLSTSTQIVSNPRTFSTTITYALTDANNGKTFTIANFPASCIIKEIRTRSNFTAGQQTWRVAFVNNANGIIPTDTSINCLTAEIFQVGDYIYIEDEVAYVGAVDNVNNIITVVRGLKGTTAAYHNFGARMETMNDGIRVALFKSAGIKLIDRIELLKDSIMTWRGTTSASISANDKVIKCTNTPLNMEKYEALYISDGVNSERASIEEINGIMKNATYSNNIYVADPLLAHAAGVEIQKQEIYDVPTSFSGGDGNLYGITFVDEKLDSTLYPSGINITLDILVDVFSTR